MFQTFQTKVKNEMIVLPNHNKVPLYTYCERFAAFFGKVERALFVDLYIRKKPSNALKTAYCKRFNLTSRQYNSIKKQLDGRVSSKIELTKRYLSDTEHNIKRTKEIMERKMIEKEKRHQSLLQMKGNEPDFRKKIKRYRDMRRYIHELKRKLYALELKFLRLQHDQKQGRIRLCFGSKKLFRKQFHLKENNLTFREWHILWKEARASQFTFIGSKDEVFGNQSCTYGTDNTLRIRVNTQDETLYGKHITIPNVTFSYGQKMIDQAKIPTIGYTKGKGTKTTYYRALTSKFIRKNNAWYVYMSVDIDEPPVRSIDGNGCIGIDFNVGFLAVTEVDRYGNKLNAFHVPFKMDHVSKEQAKQRLSVALKVAVDYAADKQKPIAYETLDFKKKKQQLKQLSKKQAKMLSGFAYAAYQEMLESKCKKAGVKRTGVSPAYTSQMGHHKYMKKYGLSSHQSAAMVIARRALRFKQVEKLPSAQFVTKNNKHIMQKNRFDQWKELINQWKSYSFHQKTFLLNTMY